jgi:hypothetical protein
MKLQWGLLVFTFRLMQQKTTGVAAVHMFPAGGKFSMAYRGSALSSLAQIKEQIMLNGGVLQYVAKRIMAVIVLPILYMLSAAPDTSGIVY